MTRPLSPEKIRQQLREMAYRLLAVRARGVGELRLRLRNKYSQPEIIEEIIAELEAKGYLNDEDFARQLAREKWTSSTWDPGESGRNCGLKVLLWS